MSKFAYYTLISVIMLIALLGRWQLLKDTEPRVDQAYLASVIRGIVEANHFWPRKSPDQSFWLALRLDEASLLQNVGRPVFNNPVILFNSVPVLIASTVCKLFSYSYANLVFLSILTTCLCLPVMGFLPFAGISGSREPLCFLQIIGFGAALVYASALQVSLFSPWGVHNAGVFFLVVAVAASIRLLRDPTHWRHESTRPMLLIVLFAAIACYAHWTNVLVLVPALAAAFLFIPNVPFSRRVALSSAFALLLGAILSPVGFLAAFLHRTSDNFLVYMAAADSGGSFFSGLPSRAWKWFLAGCELFSPGGLLLGTAGLVWLAHMYRMFLPLLCLTVHFLAYCIIPGFIWNSSPTWLRTYNYALPFLAVGIGAMLMVAWRGLPDGRWAVAARVGIACCLLQHLYAQIPQVHSAAWMRGRSPDFYDYYLQGQGSLRPAVASLALTIREEEPILFWDYPVRFLYQSLVQSSRRNPILPSTIANIANGARKIEERVELAQLPTLFSTNTHVVAPETVPIPELQKALVNILGPARAGDAGQVFLAPEGRWDTRTLEYRVLVLYDVWPIPLTPVRKP